MLHALAEFICLTASIKLTEWIVGYRSLFRSVPLYFLLVGLAPVVLTRFLIYPRIARVHHHLQQIDYQYDKVAQAGAGDGKD